METLVRKVALEGIRFFAYHGYYPEEQLTGTEFIVDVETTVRILTDISDDLTETVNYERLFAIVSEQMKQPRKLIERVAYLILKDIRQEFSNTEQVRVAIRKMHPPMGGDVANSLVEVIFSR